MEAVEVSVDAITEICFMFSWHYLHFSFGHMLIFLFRVL